MSYTIKASATICFLLVVLAGSHMRGRAQEPGEFRSLLGGFAIELPRNYSAYHGDLIEVAGRSFPVRIYSWQTANEIVTITFGVGRANLEEPGARQEFLSDYRASYVAECLKHNGRLTSESPWAFDGHSGFQLTEEQQGILVDFRVFVVEDRFYTMSVAVRAAQRQLSEKQQRLLNSFRFLSSGELAEEKERFIASFTPPPLPQEPAIRRVHSDAEDENLHDRVRRVFTEEAFFYGQPVPAYPVTREDFDERGYLTVKIGYSGDLPVTALRYGYQDGARVCRKAVKVDPGNLLNRDDLGNVKDETRFLKIEHKYDAAGSLVEVTTSGANGKPEERFFYKNHGRHRETIFSGKAYAASLDVRTRWQSSVELDDGGNPITEDRSNFGEFPNGEYVTVDKQLDSYGVVSGALKTGTPPPAPLGNVNRSVTPGDVAKNPNQTQKVTQPTGGMTTRKISEEKLTYTYEYDSHRNWIKQITSSVEKTKGGPTVVPIRVTYRTISYY